MKTERIFYQDVYTTAFDAVVEAIRQDDKGTWVRLDRTAFYPEGGGQPCDIGYLEWDRSVEDTCRAGVKRLAVADVHEMDEAIWHRVKSEECQEDLPNRPECLKKSGLAVGTHVRGEIDWPRRLDLMQQHSGEHMVSGLIHERFGYDNVGFHLSMENMTIDLSGELTWEELMEIEAAANRLVRENSVIGVTYPTAEELEQIPYRSKKELSGEVRIVEIPGGDICACCGTHVHRTGEIGLIKITAMQKWKNGVRVWMCCGARAEQFCRTVQEQNRRISVALSAKPEETATAVDRVSVELNQLKQELTGWKYRYYAEVAKPYRGQDSAVLFESDLSMDDLRHLADKLMDACSGVCFVFSGKDGEGYRYTVGKRGGDVRGLVKEMNGALSGRGGGKSEMAQGTVQAARAEIEDWIGKRTDRK